MYGTILLDSVINSVTGNTEDRHEYSRSIAEKLIAMK